MNAFEAVVKLAPIAKGERVLTMLFRALVASGKPFEDRIPFDPILDTVVYEHALPIGKADIVIYHVDGSASVIEAKDGNNGWRSVVGGIGQVGFYSTQLAVAPSPLIKVRRCLLWTSTGSVEADALISDVCISAGVIPMPWGRLDEHVTETRETLSKVGISV